jgi:leucyl aminopeptidase (aminopeptidase T)
MTSAHIVFDITSGSWMYTPANGVVMGSGHTRMLEVRPVDTRLIGRPPTPSITRKAQIAGELFDAAVNGEVRITSNLGTDLFARYKGRPVSPQDGVVRFAGEWDSQGTGFANCFPIEDSGQGVVVFNGPFKLAGGESFIAEELVTATIQDGRIVDIQGGDDASRFKTWIDSYNDPNMRVIAHLGYGFDPRGGPPPLPVETGDYGSWEVLNGGVIVAFGANLGRSGGTNVAASHCDMTLLEANFFLDQKQIIKDGKFVIDGLRD